MKGKFVTFEGCEGVGKSRQVKLLEEYLKKNNVKYYLTREPGGTPLSEKIREIILDKNNASMTDECEALLYASARAQLLKEEIAPRLERGELVICDRYMDTTNAYQGYAHGLGIDKMEKLYNLAIGDFKPDLTIIFDIDPSKSHGNLTEINRFEKMGNDWLSKSLNGFREVAKQNPNRCILMPSDGGIEEVSERILKILNEKLGL